MQDIDWQPVVGVISGLTLAAILFVGRTIRKMIINSRKEAANNHRYLSMQIESSDYAWSNLNNTVANREISTSYRHLKKEKWAELEKEYEIKNEGLN